MDRNLLSRLKKGAFLINIARGGIINDSDLCDAINSGQLSGCALDVFEPEPLPASSPLLKLPQDKVFYTPHISWAGSQADIKDEFSAENLWNFVNGAELKAVIRDITL